MYYIVETDKPFDQVLTDLEAAVTQHGFGVLHVHNIGQTLRNKGEDFKEQCHVFEVCNPHQAAKVLSSDMRLNMALPCRISVYTDQGKAYIGLIKPEPMLLSLSDDDDLKVVASEVQQKIIQMVDDAC
ncbi:DUF302 domain-containing protein [Parahaliea maris]|uniref:DUF302 domain-containing protein n=1 Tax=Parahaliea maris TaxID=2716870 RepID=A0A5C8ZWG4_9GAMM|nr:DUF302 domain-containing protein [Parahaliea maris]TXS92905.1 DUF302 domain-containing protein [Parahaliea maris]